MKLATNPTWPNIPELRITAIGQDVTIEGVEVNGGNCDLNQMERFPRTIPKGLTDHVDILSNCDSVSQAAIRTADGRYTFNF